MNNIENNYGFMFRDWNLYENAREYRKNLNQYLRKFPKKELFALTDQTRRALLSIVLNIAESSNKNTDKDSRVYINRAQCSLDEVVACFDCALDEGYIIEKEHREILEKSQTLAKQLNGFNGYLSKTNHYKSEIRDKGLEISNGFTLVELILYAALVGILLTAGAVFASDVVYSSVKGRVRAKVQHEATLALEKMRQEIVKGKNIIAPIQGNSGNILQLEIPGTPTNTLTCFQVSGNKVLQVSYGGIILPIASCNTTWRDLTSGEVEVTALNFQNISSGTSLGEEAVKIQMTVKNKNPGGKKEFDAEVNLETSIALRL